MKNFNEHRKFKKIYSTQVHIHFTSSILYTFLGVVTNNHHFPAIGSWDGKQLREEGLVHPAGRKGGIRKAILGQKKTKTIHPGGHVVYLFCDLKNMGFA